MNVELHAFADDWLLSASETLSLHALADDWKLSAVGDVRQDIRAYGWSYYFLVDHDGNFFVDHDGNFLVSAERYAEYPLLLHSLQDDFKLNG